MKKISYFILLLLLFILGLFVIFSPKKLEAVCLSSTDKNQSDSQLINSDSQLIDLNQNYDTHPNQDKFGINKNAPINYYMLALSWSPEFCRNLKIKNNGKILKKHQLQCVYNPQEKWVIHGLWPQNKRARAIKQHPRFCQGDLPPINPKIMQPYLASSPGYSILQGEWEKHGSCAFQTPEAYFQKQQELFNNLNLPNQAMNINQTKKFLEENNPKLKNKRFYIQTNEIRICYDLNWRLMSCPK